MLLSIHIENFAIIEKLELEVSGGMTVITGETGAGKSIAIDALGFALGARADSDAIRAGQDKADISACFAIDDLDEVRDWLTEQELDSDDECILRRVLSREGRARAFINGRPVSLTLLRELGARLVEIHGQHEHQSLLRTSSHRKLLDRFAGHDALVTEVATLARRVRQQKQRLEELQTSTEQRLERKSLLEYQVQELEALQLDPAELGQIEQTHKRAANAASLLEESQLCLQQLYDDDQQSVYLQLNQISSRLERMADMDPELKASADLVATALTEIQEAAGDLRAYGDRLELDPEQLAQLDQRLAALHDMARKHQVASFAELPEVLAAQQAELENLSASEADSRELAGQLDESVAAYRSAAGRLGKSRRKAAGLLGKEVETLMKQLALGEGEFRCQLEDTPADTCPPEGLESIEFLVTTNPGQPLAPLRKVASGGELSRISLALQVINARCGQLPCLIFDEVDVGIGGGTAEIVGRLLRQLGQVAQILCVTHQAQVAAQGSTHLKVGKLSSKSSTRSQVEKLDSDARVDELARMIGGLTITENTLSHAREMLANASN